MLQTISISIILEYKALEIKDNHLCNLNKLMILLKNPKCAVLHQVMFMPIVLICLPVINLNGNFNQNDFVYITNSILFYI